MTLYTVITINSIHCFNIIPPLYHCFFVSWSVWFSIIYPPCASEAGITGRLLRPIICYCHSLMIICYSDYCYCQLFVVANYLLLTITFYCGIFVIANYLLYLIFYCRLFVIADYLLLPLSDDAAADLGEDEGDCCDSEWSMWSCFWAVERNCRLP